MGGSVDNEYVKLAWRREHPDLNKLNHYQFGDTTGALIDQLGIREKNEVVAFLATFIFYPYIVIHHVSVYNLNFVLYFVIALVLSPFTISLLFFLLLFLF